MKNVKIALILDQNHPEKDILRICVILIFISQKNLR